MIRIVSAYRARAAEAGRIDCDSRVTGASTSVGVAMYLKSGVDALTAVTTRVNGSSEATSYTIDGGDSQSGNAADISTAVPAADTSTNTYMLCWYNDDDILIATETLEVRFYVPSPRVFSPVAASDFEVSVPAGISVNEPIDGSSNINGTVTVACNMTDAQWKTAFATYASDANILLPVCFTLPSTAEQYAIVGAGGGQSDDMLLNLLDSLQYYNYDGSFPAEQTLPLANIAYDGTSAILSPIEHIQGVALKWMESDGTEHFHRVELELTHSSMEAHKVTSAVPNASRVMFNSTGSPAVVGAPEYTDGVVTYCLNSAANISTVITPPDGATQFAVNDSDDQIGNAIVTIGVGDDGFNNWSFRLQWKNDAGAVVKTELISISLMLTTRGVWMENYWSPTDDSRMAVESGAQSILSHMTYANGLWTFQVDPSADLDMPLLTSSERFFRITPPDGAVSFKAAFWHDPIYRMPHAESTANELDNQPLRSITGLGQNEFYSPDGTLKFSLGQIIDESQLSDADITVYSVNKTMSGYADLAIFQWYDEDGELIELNGKRGDFVYLIKEPYVAMTETQVLTSDPQAPVTEPVAVASSAGFTLKTEVPIQQQDSGGNTEFVYMNLKYLDADGNEVEPGENVTVYINYPDGVTYANSAGYTFTLRHYTDENCTSYVNVTLIPTPYGLKFVTDSFSPFVLGYTPPSIPAPRTPYGYTDNPTTGDSSMPVLWMCAAIISAAAAAACAVLLGRRVKR